MHFNVDIVYVSLDNFQKKIYIDSPMLNKIKKSIFIFLSIIALFLTLSSCSKKAEKIYSPFEMKNYLSNSKPLVGDVIQFQLEIKYFNNIKVQLPDISQYLYNFTIKDYKIEDEKLDKFYNLRKIVYYITSFEDTSFVIPSYKIKYSYNGKDYEIETKRLYVKFFSTNPDMAKDIKDVKNVLYLKTNYFILILIILIICASIFALYKYHKYRENIKSELIETKYTPFEWAKIRLRKLYQKDLIKNGFIKEYYFELTEIFREYLGKMYQTNALDMTKEELLDFLKKKKVNYLSDIKNYLYETDMVKFAKYKPDMFEIEEITKRTESLIEEIKNETFIKQSAV